MLPPRKLIRRRLVLSPSGGRLRPRPPGSTGSPRRRWLVTEPGSRLMGLGGRSVCTGDARLQGARLWGAKGTTGRHVTSAVTGPRLRPVRTDLARLTPPQAPGPRPAVRVLPDETPPPEKPSSVPSGKRVASSPKLRRPRLELAPPGTPPRTHAEPLRKARPKNVLSFSRVLCPGSPGRTGCLSAALPETSAEPSAGRRPPKLKPKLRVRPGPPESNQLRHRKARPTNP